MNDDPPKCPECGGYNTVVRQIYGKYDEAECLDCGFEGDNAPPEAHFGSGYY